MDRPPLSEDPAPRTLEKTEWRLDTDLHRYAVPTGV